MLTAFRKTKPIYPTRNEGGLQPLKNFACEIEEKNLQLKPYSILHTIYDSYIIIGWLYGTLFYLSTPTFYRIGNIFFSKGNTFYFQHVKKRRSTMTYFKYKHEKRYAIPQFFLLLLPTIQYYFLLLSQGFKSSCFISFFYRGFFYVFCL